MADLESLRQKFTQAMDDSGVGTLSGLSNVIKQQEGIPTTPVTPPVPKADAGTARIPLALLPPGVVPGQRISLTITGVDGVAGMATVVPDAVQNAVAPAPAGNNAAVKPDAIDKNITMGPMNAFRSFLYQQSADQPENQQ